MKVLTKKKTVFICETCNRVFRVHTKKVLEVLEKMGYTDIQSLQTQRQEYTCCNHPATVLELGYKEEEKS